MTALRTLALLFFAATAVAGCGGADLCSGSACDCPSGDTCAFGDRGDSTRINCASGSTCTGSVGTGSQVNCSGASCTISVGNLSTVNCTSGTCSFTCNGTCVAQCGSGCTLTCVGSTQGPAGCN